MEERSGGVTVAVLKTECGRKSMEFESAPLPPVAYVNFYRQQGFLHFIQLTTKCALRSIGKS